MYCNVVAVTAALSVLAASAYVAGCGGDAAGPVDAPAAITAEPEPAQQAASDDGDASAETAADTGIAIDSGALADAGADGADAGPLQCIGTQFVGYPLGSCGADDSVGKCMARPVSCSALFEPVCACNGATYANACKAAFMGQNLRALGACPK